MRWQRLFIIAFCFAPMGSPAHGGDGPTLPEPSESIKEAMRNGTFVANVEVSPNEFDFKGHKYKIHECWKESPSAKGRKKRLSLDGIAFTLEVDGQYPAQQSGRIFFMPSDGICFLNHGKVPVHTIRTTKENEFSLQAKDPIGTIPRPGETPQLKFHVLEEPRK